MAHPDLDELLNALLPFAQQMLSAHGEFFPFGAAMNADGQIALHSAGTGSEQPASTEVIDMLIAVFRQQAANKEVRACGICYDVRVIPPGHTDKTDAICVALEHESGESIGVILPYSKGFWKRMKYGTLYATAMDRQMFLSNSDAAVDENR
jgi:hypothetical protein